MNVDKLKGNLRRDEGIRGKAYMDTVGKITIGVGRNLTDVGLTDAEIDLLLTNDITRVALELDTNLPWWRQLDDDRQNALANMCFNLGINRLLEFHYFLKALKEERWADAVAELKNSRWAIQVGQRAIRIEAVIQGGT